MVDNLTLSQEDADKLFSDESLSQEVQTTGDLTQEQADQLFSDLEPPQASTAGAFVRGAERGVIPMVTALPAIGAGAAGGEIVGGVIGGAIGSVLPVAGTAAGAAVGAAIGSFVGGVGGGFAGGVAGAEIQDFAVSKLPDTVKKKIGWDEAQQLVDEQQHPYAAQLGGLTPFLLTARPFAAPGATAAKADTALGRFMQDWRTQKAAGGVLMGGWELGQEALNGDIDWTKVGIASAFGAIFNHQNKAGQRLMAAGEAPFEPRLSQIRALRNEAADEAGRVRSVDAGLFSERRMDAGIFYKREINSDLFDPTLREVSVSGILGPGNTEKTFLGLQERNPVADSVSRMLMEDEQAMLYGPQVPDETHIATTARKLDPELFDYRDELLAMADEARTSIESYRKPSMEEYDGLRSQRKELEAELAGTKNKDEQRRIRTQIRFLQNEIDGVWSRMSGEGQLDETLTRHHNDLASINAELRRIGPEVAATNRRAAEALGRGDFIMEITPFEPESALAGQAGVAPDLFVEAQGEKAGTAVKPSMTEAMAKSAGINVPAEKAKIAEDVRRQYIDAGRTEEEAAAAAALISNRYVTRAATFQGAQGTPFEMYLAKHARVTEWNPKAPPSTPLPALVTPPTESAAGVAAAETMKAAEAKLSETKTSAPVEPGTLPEAPAAESASTQEMGSGNVDFATEAPAAPVEPIGPKVGDTLTMSGVKYKIAALDDKSVRLTPTRKKDNAAAISLPRAALDQMLGEHVAPAAQAAGEKIMLNGEVLDPKLAEIVRAKLAEQKEAPQEATTGRTPDTAEIISLRERMRKEAMSDEYPMAQEQPMSEDQPVSNDNTEETFEPASMAHVSQKDIVAEQEKLKPISDDKLLSELRTEEAAFEKRLADENRKPGVFPTTAKYHAVHRELGRRGLLQDSRELYDFLNQPHLVVDNTNAMPVAEEPWNVWQDTPDPMLDYSVLSGRQYVPQEPQTLLGFVRNTLGGIQDIGGDLKSQDINRVFPGLMNKKGMPADKAREAAVEQGYLPENSTPDDLFNKLMSGEPVYRDKDQAEAQQFHRHQETLRQANRYKSTVEHLNAEFPGNHPDIIADAAMRMTYDGMESFDALEAAAGSVSIEVPEVVKALPEIDNLGDKFDEWLLHASPKTEGNRSAQARDQAPTGRREGESGASRDAASAKGEGAFSYEAGAEGKQQAVVPGAERISDKKLAERLASAPMRRGGNEPVGGMFDEGATSKQLFDAPATPAPKVEPAAKPALTENGVIESLGRIGTKEAHNFQSGAKARLEKGPPLTEKELAFWNSKVKELSARAKDAGKPVSEHYNLSTILSGKVRDLYETQLERDSGEIKQIVERADALIERLVERINQAGFKVREVDAANAEDKPQVREDKKQISGIAGTIDRLLTGNASAGRGKQTAKKNERVAADIAEINKLFNEVEAYIAKPPMPPKEIVTPLSKEEKAALVARRKEILAEGNKLIQENGGYLTDDTAKRFIEIGKERADIDYKLFPKLNPEKIRTADERMSSLDTNTIQIAHADLMRSKPVYDAISAAADGVAFGSDTAVDSIMTGKNGQVSAKEFYEAFNATREALRAKYGDTITLYRAEGKQKQKATKNWATTEEYARQFGDNVTSKEISVDDILAVNVGPTGNYHEIIVATKPIGEGEYFQRTGKGKSERALGKYVKYATERLNEIWLKPEANPSTIIHENGHDFLEQLKEDATHEAAPGQLKSDYETVKKWVGWKEGQQDFTTKQHEKFARGFERYFFDGIAPNKELAAVFERFSNWLRDAYKTVMGLNKPEAIPEEIRAVFDRMLASEPYRVTLAREADRPSSFADTHIADAMKADVTQAGPMADRVEVERTRVIAELPKEIRNELTAAAERNGVGESATGLGAGNSGMGIVEANSGGRTTVTTGGARRADDGALGASGRNAAEESAGASRGDDTGMVPAGAATLGRDAGSTDGRFVDRAGNIRLENLTNREDLRAAIREIAYGNDGFIDARRGVISDIEGLSLAEQIGFDGAEQLVADWVRGQAFNHEEILALRLLIKESTNDLWNKAKAVQDGGDWQAVRDYALARERHIAIQRTLSGATAEWGRAGRAFRDISGDAKAKAVEKLMRQNTGSTLFQLREEADLLSKLDNEAAVNRFARDMERPGFFRGIQDYWINGLISGPTTHSTYVIANEMLALWRAVPETLTRAAISEVARAMGREAPEGERARFGEAWQQIVGWGEGFAPGLKAAAGSLKTGVTTLLPGETMRTLPGVQPGQEAVKPAPLDAAYSIWKVLPDIYSHMRSSREALIAYASALKNGVEGESGFGLSYSPIRRAIPDVTYNGVRVAPIGTMAYAPGRAIQGIHAFHRVQFYFMELNAEAFRRASAELAENKITPDQFAQRLAQLKSNPETDMVKRASDAATEGTMMKQGGELTRRVASLMNYTTSSGLQPLKFIDPFVHITSNVIENAIVARTPVGFLSKELRADMGGKNGALAQDKAIARMALGTTVMSAVAYAVMEGSMTGGEPSEPSEAAIWRKTHQAYSVKLGDTWYSYHRLGVVGLLMGISADLVAAGKHVAEEKLTEAVSALAEAFYHNIFEESFLRGPAEMFRAVENHERYGPQWIKNFGSSFMPYSVGMSQIARTVDPYSRRAYTFAEALKQKVPYASMDLLPRRDLWGEPVRNQQPTFAGGVVPTAIYQFQPSTDMVDVEMDRLGVKKSQVERKIRNVELDEKQYDDFQRIAGRMAKMQLDGFVKSERYQSYPDDIKRMEIDKIFDHQREAARNLMMMKYKQIPRDAYKARISGLAR